MNCRLHYPAMMGRDNSRPGSCVRSPDGAQRNPGTMVQVARSLPLRCAYLSVYGATMRLQRALDGLDPVALDHVAGLHVLIILKGHAAFLAGGYLARIVLEALELAELAFVHHHAVADEPHIGAALHRAVGHAAAGDVADLGDFED